MEFKALHEGRDPQRRRLRKPSVGRQSLPKPPAPPLMSYSTVMNYFTAMSGALGPMNWWPAQTPFEVIVGAILTQNTAWTNVERAIANLKAANMLTPTGISSARTPQLAKLIRSSGYFRQKALKLKAFVAFLDREYGGSLDRMFAAPTSALREQLLAVYGIGPETADSILLYSGNHPVFVVDAYTHRIFERHGITSGKPDYERVRALIESALPRAAKLFNEFHALVVNVGKNWCHKREPDCAGCPLGAFLPDDRLRTIEPCAASVSGTP